MYGKGGDEKKADLERERERERDSMRERLGQAERQTLEDTWA